MRRHWTRSGFPHAPNIIVPSATAPTSIPEDPSVRRSIRRVCAERGFAASPERVWTWGCRPSRQSVGAREPNRPSLGDPTTLVTLVDGQTFCLSGRSGDFGNNPTHGVFFADMRVLSRARLLRRRRTVEPLAVALGDASSATFVGRSQPPGAPQPRSCWSCAVARSARCGTSRSSCATRHGDACPDVVELEVAADFADVFAVKEGRAGGRRARTRSQVGEQSLLFGWRLGRRRTAGRADRRRRRGRRSRRRGFQWIVDLDASRGRARCTST